MSTVIAIGDDPELPGFALAGVGIRRARTDSEIIDAWTTAEPDVGLVILSTRAASVLGAALVERPDVLTVVLP